MIVESNLEFESPEHLLEVMKMQPAEPIFRLHAIYMYDETGQKDKAYQLYLDSKQLFENSCEFNYLLSDYLLKNRYWKEGWAMWEYRPNFMNLKRANKECPVWDGSPLNGRTLLVAGEHGIGDQIMFAQFLPQLSKQNGKVVCYLEMPQILDRLLSSVSPIPVISDPFLLNEYDNIDCWTAIGSLPFNLSVEPSPEPYINIPTHRFMPLDRLQVGLCWKGNPRNERDRWRSFDFDVMHPLIDVPCDFFSLQKDDTTSLLPNMCNYTKDFMDVAEMVANLDLVITVDTSIAHLAGAMGKPVWVLLPIPAGQACDWRWGTSDQRTCEWYGSAKLFWQKTPGDWKEVIERVRKELYAYS